MSKSSKATSYRRVVSLQSFEHLDVISMVDEGTDHGKLLFDLFFYHNMDTFDIHFHCNFLENLRPKKRKSKLRSTNQHVRNHSVIVKTLIE